MYSACDLDIDNMIVLISTRNIGRRIKILRNKFFNSDTGHAYVQKSFELKNNMYIISEYYVYYSIYNMNLG